MGSTSACACAVENKGRTMKRVRIEEWKSSQNHEEVHYFLSDDGTSGEVYVGGRNPELVEEQAFLDFMASQGYELA